MTQVLASHGDALRMAKTIREIQQRSEPRQRPRSQMMERSFSYLEVPDIPQGRVAWFSIVEDPVDRAVRSFKGSVAELEQCVQAHGVRGCIACNSMTAWFCGGGAMCSMTSRGAAALVRAKLVLARDYIFVAVRERWLDSILVLEKLLPGYFDGAAQCWLDAINQNTRQRERDFLDSSEALPSAGLRPEARQLILEANAFDVELYNHAITQLEIIAFACLGRPSFSNALSAAASLQPATSDSHEGEDDDIVATNRSFANGKLPADILLALGQQFVPDATDGLAGLCVKRKLRARRRRRLLSGVEERENLTGLPDNKDRKTAANSYCFPAGVGVGASRAGIGVISALLKEHPGVRAPEKALSYFGRALKRGRRGMLNYLRNFPVSDRERQLGTVAFEASPEYALSIGALREIRALLGPQVKIVFALREPMARAYDDFWRYARFGRLYQHDRELFICYEHAFGTTDPPAEGEERSVLTKQQRSSKICASRGERIPPRAISPLVFDAYARQVVLDAWEPELRPVARRAAFNDSLPLNYETGELNENILSKSFYAPQVTRLLAIFPRGQTHFVVYENLFSPTKGPALLEGLADFLNVVDHSSRSKHQFFTAERVSAAATSHESPHTSNLDAAAKTPYTPYPPMLRKSRRLLEAFYMVDSELLKRMLPDLELPW